MNSLSDIDRILSEIPAVDLAEMDSVKLMNRIDTKYFTTQERLVSVLEAALRSGYRVLEVDGLKRCPYDSVYFDTAGLRMFLDHHNRRLVREKIRTRVYLSSGQTFLEIKLKNNRGRTRKKRIPLDRILPEGGLTDPGAAAFLRQYSIFPPEYLSPALETRFDRITLVNPEKTERMTLDTSLLFRNVRNGRSARIPGGVILELKQDGRGESRMKEILRELRVKPLRISKYCLGTALTDPAVKANRFKMKIRKTEKIIQAKIDVL